MEPNNWLLTADLAAIIIVIYALDRNVFRAIGVLVAGIPTFLARDYVGIQLRIRLWIDRQALIHRGPLGRLWNEYSLWQIRRNPAYREFFQDRSE